MTSIKINRRAGAMTNNGNDYRLSDRGIKICTDVLEKGGAKYVGKNVKIDLQLIIHDDELWTMEPKMTIGAREILMKMFMAATANNFTSN